MSKDVDLSSASATASMDGFLAGKKMGSSFESVRGVVGKEEEIPKNASVGTRVVFKGGSGVSLVFKMVPKIGMTGTIVETQEQGSSKIRNARAHLEGRETPLNVRWDDETQGLMYPSYMRLAKEAPKKKARVIRVASLQYLSQFMKVAENTLIHKSTKELWSMRSEEGGFVIERLFDASGDPLKG